MSWCVGRQNEEEFYSQLFQIPTKDKNEIEGPKHERLEHELFASKTKATANAGER